MFCNKIEISVARKRFFNAYTCIRVIFFFFDQKQFRIPYYMLYKIFTIIRLSISFKLAIEIEIYRIFSHLSKFNNYVNRFSGGVLKNSFRSCTRPFSVDSWMASQTTAIHGRRPWWKLVHAFRLNVLQKKKL